MKMTADIDELARIVREGGVIVYPTDTIWGIGCDATNASAVDKIFSLKNRPAEKSMIVLVESEQRLQNLVDVPAMAWVIMDVSEKPITIVYEHAVQLPPNVLAPDGSIGIRLTKDQFCKKLIGKINAPLISTSANTSGKAAPVNFEQIDEQILALADAVVDPSLATSMSGAASSVIQVWADGRVKVHRE